jgi:hypothetical protein
MKESSQNSKRSAVDVLTAGAGKTTDVVRKYLRQGYRLQVL